MTDDTVIGRIEALVQEEHQLRTQEQHDSADPEALQGDRARLQQVQVELDRCWDLLRQRRALRGAGEDPEGAAARDEDTVEGYLQ